MVKKLEITELYYDNTSDETPRVWTVVGLAHLAGGTEESIATSFKSGINVQISYGPSADWSEQSDEPPKALNHSSIRKVKTLSLDQFKHTKAENGSRIWIANFYPDIEDDLLHFLRFVTDSDENTRPGFAPKILVSAWCDAVSDADVRPARRLFGKEDLKFKRPWNVGVLLVHGISKFDTNSVLVGFGEPLVEFIQKWSQSYNSWSAARFSQSDRKTWVEEFENKSAYFPDYSDLLGVKASLNAFKGQSDYNHETVEIDKCHENEPILITTRVHDTQVKGDLAGTTLLGIFAVNKHGLMADATIIIKESNWSDHAIEPTHSVMKDWIWHAYPAVTANYIHRRRHRSEFGNAIAPRWLSVLISGLFHLWAPIYLFLVLVMMVVLRTLLSLTFVPLRIVKNLIERLFVVLSGTIGHSYAFSESITRRRAITHKTKQDLDWLTDHCDRISIVSHSQGVAVTQAALKSRRYKRLENWNILGSGLHPLLVLRDKTNESINKQAKWLLGLVMALVSPVILAIFLDIPNSGAINHWDIVGYLLVLYLILWIVVMHLSSEAPTTNTESDYRPNTLNGAKEYFSTHDPVPMGAIWNLSAYDEERLEGMIKGNTKYYNYSNKSVELPQSHQVYNQFSNFFDHTTYMENVEEVVSRIAFDIMSLARKDTDLPEFDKLHASTKTSGLADKDETFDEQRVALARQRRRKFVIALGVSRFLLFLLIIGILAFLIVLSTTPSLQLAGCSFSSITDCKTAFEQLQGKLSPAVFGPAIYSFVVLICIRIYLRSRLVKTREWLLGPKSVRHPDTMFDRIWSAVLGVAILSSVYFWLVPSDLSPMLNQLFVLPIQGVIGSLFYN